MRGAELRPWLTVRGVRVAQTHGFDCSDRMYLLRMHADRDTFELVKCADLRREAAAVLALECERLGGPCAPEFSPGLLQSAVEAAWWEAADQWEAPGVSASAATHHNAVEQRSDEQDAPTVARGHRRQSPRRRGVPSVLPPLCGGGDASLDHDPPSNGASHGRTRSSAHNVKRVEGLREKTIRAEKRSPSVW